MAVITKESVQSATVSYSFEVSTARNGRGGNPMVVFRSTSPFRCGEMAERTSCFLKNRAASAGKTIKLTVTSPKLDKHGVAMWYSTVPVYNFNTFSQATRESLEIKFSEAGIIPLDNLKSIGYQPMESVPAPTPSDEAILSTEPEWLDGVPAPAMTTTPEPEAVVEAPVPAEIVPEDIDTTSATINSLNKLTVKQLRTRLTSLNIKAQSSLRKPALIEMLAKATA